MTGFRTYDDVGLPWIKRVNRAATNWLAIDQTEAPLTAIMSLRFIVPEQDVKPMPKLDGYSSVKYPKPIAGWREKRIFAPVRTNDGVMVTVLWWKWLGEWQYFRGRQMVARALDDLYPRIIDPVRPVVAVRVHLVDWNLGYSVNPKKLRDKWYAERSFMNTRIDTLNLKSWGIAGSAPIGLDTGRDTMMNRWQRERNGSKPAIDPIVEDLGLQPKTLARQVLDDFLADIEGSLDVRIAAAKRLNPTIARMRARQAMMVLRGRQFEQQVVEKLYSIYIERATGPGKVRKQDLVETLIEWLNETVENRYFI